MSDLVAYRPPPPPIPKRTLKKEELSLRERLWVWNDVVAAALTAISFVIGFAWLQIPLTMEPVGMTLVLLGSVGFCISVTIFMVRAQKRQMSPYGSSRGDQPIIRLSHRSRAQLCLLDRNRRARPHRGNFLYAPSLYSVFPTIEDFGEGRQLYLLMLHHIRPKPYLLCYLLPRRLRFSQRCWWVSIPPGPNAKVKLGMHPAESEVHRRFEEMEGAAMALEERPHLDTIQDFRAEEVALNLRRQPPSAKSQAINLARKAIK